MNRQDYQKNWFAYFLLVTLLVMMVASLWTGCTTEASAQTKYSRASRIDLYVAGHDSSVRYALLHPDLRDTLAYIDPVTGHVEIADSALALKFGILHSGHLRSSFLDSIKNTLVDVAKFAENLLPGAIKDRSDFSATAFDSVQNYWTQKSVWAETAERADSSDYSDNSGFASVSDRTNQDTISYSLGSRTADYATIAGTSLDTVFVTELADSIFDQIVQATRDSIGAIDTSTWADTVYGYVDDNAIEHLGAFTSTMQTTYIPTANQKSALTNAPAALTSANPVMDTTTARLRFVEDLDQGATNPKVSILFGEKASLSPQRMVFDTSGVDSGLWLQDRTGTTFFLVDTANVRSMIRASLEDTLQYYPLITRTGTPINISSDNSGEPGSPGSVGDIHVAMAPDCMVYFYDSDNDWKPIRGGGGGTTANQIVRSVAPSPVSTDDIALINRATTISSKWTFTDTSTVLSLLPQSGSSNIGRNGDEFTTGYVKNIFTDLLDADATSEINVEGNFRPNATNTYALGADTRRWNEIYGHAIDLEGPGTTTSLWPQEDNNINMWLGTTDRRYVRVVSTQAYHTDSVRVYNTSAPGTNHVYIHPTGGIDVTGARVNLNGALADLSVAGGDLSVTGSGETDIATAHTHLDFTTKDGHSGLFLARDSVWVPDLSAHRFMVTPGQNYGLDVACAPSATNPFLTKKHFQEASKLGAVRYAGDQMFGYWFQGSQVLSGLLNDPSLTCTDSTDVNYNNLVFVELEAPGLDTSVAPAWPFVPVMAPVHWGIDTLDDPDPDNRDSAFSVIGWDNPLNRREYIVNDAGNDSLGRYTGYFRTIQGAVNSLPNAYAYCRENSASDSSLLFVPDSVIQLRLGTTVVDTADVLPLLFANHGTWFKVHLASAYAQSKKWTTIDKWVDADTTSLDTFSIADTDLFGGVDLSNRRITLSVPWTITIDPKRDGSAWRVDSVVIPDVAPITIRGATGGVRITNMSRLSGGITGPTAYSVTMFSHPLGDSTSGLPITFENLTIIAAAGVGSSPPVMDFIHGAVRLNDVRVTRIGAGNGGEAVIRFSPLTLFDQTRNALIVSRSVISADSNVVLIRTTNKIRLQSNNNAYSLGGSKGSLLYVSEDMSSAPQFFGDQIYATPSVGTSYAMFNAEDIQSDSVSLVNCWITGDTLSFDGANFITQKKEAQNTLQFWVTDPPVPVMELFKEVHDFTVSPK